MGRSADSVSSPIAAADSTEHRARKPWRAIVPTAAARRPRRSPSASVSWRNSGMRIRRVPSSLWWAPNEVGRIPVRASDRGPKGSLDRTVRMRTPAQAQTMRATMLRSECGVEGIAVSGVSGRARGPARTMPALTAPSQAMAVGLPVTPTMRIAARRVSQWMRRLHVAFMVPATTMNGPRRSRLTPATERESSCWPQVGHIGAMIGWHTRARPTPQTWEGRAVTRKRRAPRRRSMAMPRVSSSRSPIRGVRGELIQAVTRVHRCSGWCGSAASQLERGRWPGEPGIRFWARNAMRSSAARTAQTRPLRIQARPVRAAATRRGRMR